MLFSGIPHLAMLIALNQIAKYPNIWKNHFGTLEYAKCRITQNGARSTKSCKLQNYIKSRIMQVVNLCKVQVCKCESSMKVCNCVSQWALSTSQRQPAFAQLAHPLAFWAIFRNPYCFVFYSESERLLWHWVKINKLQNLEDALFE